MREDLRKRLEETDRNAYQVGLRVVRRVCELAYAMEIAIRESGRHGEYAENVDAAFQLIATSTARQIAAVQALGEAGLSPEALAHARTLWELAIDASFILSLSRKETIAYGRMYREAWMVRQPLEKRAFETEGDTPRSRRFREEQSKVREENPLLDPEALHWSGKKRSTIRKRAIPKLREVVPPAVWPIVEDSQLLMFNMGSVVVHADPAAAVLYPKLDGGAASPNASRGHFAACLPMSATAALLSLSVLAQRASEHMKEQVQLVWHGSLIANRDSDAAFHAVLEEIRRESR